MWPGNIVYGLPTPRKAVLSVELQDDKEAGREFLSSNQKIWDAMSGLLGQIAPGVFKQFQNRLKYIGMLRRHNTDTAVSSPVETIWVEV